MERSLESAIDRNQLALDKIEIKLAEETIYDEVNKVLLTELLQKQGQLKVELSEAEEKWLETHQQLDQI
jgi:ATP-binding cassette subfamily F protein 3